MNQKSSLTMMVFAALLAALTAVGAYIAIPIGPVPIVLSNMFVMISGLLLGKKWAPASVGIYLLLGIIGLPVFSGGASGPAVFAGPTGGFLIGFPISAFLIALICGSEENSLIRDILAILVGIIVVYLIGVPWLKINLDMEWPRAFKAGMTPFIPGDLLKGVAAILLVRVIRPRFND